MLRYGLLGLLSYRDLSGYEMSKCFKESIGFFWSVTMSQVYRELGTMLDKGWLKSETVLQETKPNKRIYSITDEGRRALLQWLDTYNGESFFKTRNSFLVNLFFSGQKDVAKTIDFLKRLRVDCLEYAGALQQTDQSIEYYSQNLDDKREQIYWDIVADLGRSQIYETINWIERSIGRLEAIQ